MRLKLPNGRFQVYLSARALRTVVVLVLALALSAHVLAADFEAGLEAYKRGDYATALEELRPLAEQSDASAQYTLGIMYAYGEGVAQDYVLSHMWFNLAAAHPPADVIQKAAATQRYKIEGKMTPEQIAEAQRLARQWKPQ